MKRQVDIYIEGIPNSNDYSKLDLFDDEKINVNSSIQNIQDISKVYTDFSQSFTVPASENNNRIFEYFYQNDVDGAIDHNLRRYAYIEIGMVPFRTGKIQLEGSSVKNGRIEHYSITFYGDLMSLKDIFGATKLNQLDYSFISNPYTQTAVAERIKFYATDYDIRYPLISNQNVWTYNDGSSTDIKTVAGGINWRELNPAVKVSKIFEAIENDFGLTFQSAFFQTWNWKNLFLWCKNRTDIDEKINGLPNVIDAYNEYPDYQGNINNIYDPVNVSYYLGLSGFYKTWLTCTFIIDNPPSPSTPWIIEIDTYNKGVFYSTTIINTAINTSATLYQYVGSASSGIVNLHFIIRSQSTINLKYTITAERFEQRSINNAPTKVTGGYVITKNTIGLNLAGASNSLYSNMPDITLSDFFSGILKEFNLTCYSVGVDTFQIEPLDHWYSKGATIDITKYVDTDTISVDRLPLYKNISFNYQKSESFLNREWGDRAGREWGDISTAYPYDGGDFNVTVPFENLQFTKFIGTTTHVGYSLTSAPDFKPYVPKPVLMYFNGAMATNFQLKSSAFSETINGACLFGQDLDYNGTIYSLNFSSDTSTWYSSLISNSLFATYYFGYLSNLFNTKNRLTKVKAYFPIGLITNLRLNDRLIIQDKRYIINTINSDITNGEVSLELINDFRPIFNIT
ncbi:hypothetical protein UFOVP622_17 [uncultured Caudovirales phage]|uniref:Uncharacterized protein n=1 Tax=uncultured Caudovirales phage TaxID=2100421 RepID=A0A6J5N7K6_9CAUD|nr:hypothetical protein UFOVP622_17 [uncultured Caudovirales phage]